MSSLPCIDIVIVNYFSAVDVARCLAQLSPWPHGTIWLVDNSADAAEGLALRERAGHLPFVTIIDPGKNLGFGRGCNLAFETSSAPLVLLLNPDAQVSKQDLITLARTVQEDPRLGAASPRIYWNEARTFLLPEAFPQTPATAVGQALASRTPAMSRWMAARYIHRQQARMTSGTPYPVSFLAGAVLMLRREAVIEAGGLFDPGYFMFFEDSDLSLRLRRSGYRLAMVPTAAAVHEYRHKAFKADMMAQSRDRYYVKNFPRFHRLSDGLSKLDRMSHAVETGRWFDVLAKPCATLQDFTSQAGPAGVLAFSPSMLMMPAIFRPRDAVVKGFSEDEWSLLEPAAYVALMPNPTSGERWVHFERVA
jgi:GT2 family glycosyltransferase